jgi:hypothetical protein
LKRLTRSAGLSVQKGRYVDSLGFLAALTFKIVGSKKADLGARGIALYDGYIVPPSRVFDSLLVGSFGKNVHVVASKNLKGSRREAPGISSQ